MFQQPAVVPRLAAQQADVVGPLPGVVPVRHLPLRRPLPVRLPLPLARRAQRRREAPGSVVGTPLTLHIHIPPRCNNIVYLLMRLKDHITSAFYCKAVYSIACYD